MIKVVSHDHLQDCRIVNATRVVVYDRHDNPVAIVLEMPNGSVVTSHWADPEWNTIMANLGIRQTVVISNVPNIPLDQVRFDS